MITVYGDHISGNCYKLALILALTGREHRWINIDVVKGEARSAEFLQKNPNGRVPLVAFDDGTFLAESNAALFYFAQNSGFWPVDSRRQAEVLQWMFFEQYSHEPYIATSRFWIHFLKGREMYARQLAEAKPKGYAALDVMEGQLSRGPWFVGDGASIADIALFAYTHRAQEGDFSLDQYPAIRSWIERLQQLPDFVAMRE